MMKTFEEDSEDDLKEFSDSDQHEGLDGSEFSSDQESDDDEDADVSDDEAENIHHRLVQAIERFSKSEEPITKRGVKSGASTKFSAESSTFHGTEEVSLDALLNALDSTKGISTVKKTLADLEKLVGIPTHVEKVVSDRMERDLTYSKNKGEMSKWDSIVTSNRHVKSLDLAQDKRQQLSYKSLVTKFKPSNDFEEEVNMVVLKSNVADAEAEGQEIEQLRGKKMSSKEIRQKQAELAKVKALLFYEQIKRHRLNKIKSKAYHRIRKRQKQKRIGSAEPEQGDESDEEEEEQVDQSLERVKERMSLRHKNTGKWARMASSRAHTDKSLKQAYHDSVLLGQELSKKMSDDPASDRTHPQDNSDSESVDQEFGEPLSTKTAKSMKKSIDKSEIEGNMSMSSRLGDSKYGKLLDMNFMKRAASIQREKALEDAQTVLRELQDLEAQELSEEEFPASAKSTDDKRLQEAKKAMDKIFSRTTNSVALSSSKKSIVREAAGLSVENTSSWDSEVPNEAEISPVAAAPKSENPWMDSKPQPLNPKLKSLASKKSDSVVHVTALPISKAPSAAVVLLSSEDNKESKSKANGRKPLLMQKSQAELVRSAFSGPDLEEEFRSFKNSAIEEELEIDTKKMKILKDVKAGWGDWAGPGETGVSQSTLKRRDRLFKRVEQAGAEKKAARRDATISDVMINERRVKASSKFKISEIPHPFTTREEYERSMQMPLGEQWNASHVVRTNTKPEIIKRAGRIIEPVKLPKSNSSRQSAEAEVGAEKGKRKRT